MRMVWVALAALLVACAGEQEGSHVQRSGRLVRIADVPSAPSGVEYRLRETSSGASWLLNFDECETPLQEWSRWVGSLVEVEAGVGRSGQLNVHSLRFPGENSGLGKITQTIVSAGERKVAVLLVNFRNNPDRSVSKEQARSYYFDGPTSAAAYFKEVSYGKLTFSGDVMDYVTIPFDYDRDTVLLEDWRRAAEDLNRENGVDLSPYDHVSLLFANRRLAFANANGFGDEPGRYTWISGAAAVETVWHELGHNLGMAHAGSYVCPDIPLGRFCTDIEYGDPFDIMGQGSGHVNAYHKGQMGWLEPHNFVTVEREGMVSLAPLEQATSNPVAVRVPVPSRSDFYYVEYRQPLGFDSDLGIETHGVQIRRVLDVNPGAKPQILVTNWADENSSYALPLNATFQDGPVSITLVERDSRHARVQIGGRTRPVDPNYGSFLLSLSHPRHCVSINLNSKDEGAISSLQQCNGSRGQRFKFVPIGNGAYHVTNIGSRMCLALTRDSPDDGIGVVQRPCTDSKLQRWLIRPEASNPMQVTLATADERSCVQFPDRAHVGAQLRQRFCDGSEQQRFEITEALEPSPLSVAGAGGAINSGGNSGASSDGTAGNGAVGALSAGAAGAGGTSNAAAGASESNVTPDDFDPANGAESEDNPTGCTCRVVGQSRGTTHGTFAAGFLLLSLVRRRNEPRGT